MTFALTKSKSEFDYMCYLSETLYNSNSLIRFAAQATLFKPWLLTTFAATSKILCLIRLQNSPYFCVFKYARVVKQKVWNGAENRERTDFEKKTDCFAV